MNLSEYNNKIICGDSLKILKTFPNNFIDMAICSPPYYNLRDYKIECQLGLEKDYNLYISKLCDIFDEVKRTLKDTGSLYVNIGDTYAGANGYSSDQYEEIKEKYKDKEGYTPTKVAQFFDRPNKKVEEVQNKGLIQIPARFSIEMCNRGWCLRNVIIWHKPVIMPSSAKDRFTNDYEFLYFFVKNPQDYYFETQYEPLKESSIKRAKYGLMQSEDEGAKNNAVNVQTMKMGERFVNPKGRIKRTVWTINPDVNKKKDLKHYATYPIDLVKTPILASCPENGLVLDPFMGSGTTALAAKKYKRNYIGIEINPKYIEIANNRLNDNSNMEDVIIPNEVSLLGELL